LLRVIRRCVAVAAIVSGLFAAELGASAHAAAPTRSVKVKMVDVAYEPTVLTATVGETVRFSFINRGKATHDAFVGTRAEQKQHEREMRAADDDGHGGGHDGTVDTEGVTLKPGKRGSLTYTFDEPGDIQIGCHEPGHYKAGMVINVTVSEAPPS
jgi:uncharacterized cupredoxin-like copper-binding protein